MITTVLLLSIILSVRANQVTQAESIVLQPSTVLYGDTFDNETYGKDIMFLFWSSKQTKSKLFKTSVFDMLYTEKHKWVFSKNITVANIDCAYARNLNFCLNFAPFEAKLPHTIAVSNNNEPFKQYNGSFTYPALTKFLYEYFERSCVHNKQWCTEEDEELIRFWKNLTLEEQVLAHKQINEDSDTAIKAFEQHVANIRKDVHRRQNELQALVDSNDEKAKLLNELLYRANKTELLKVLDGSN